MGDRRAAQSLSFDEAFTTPDDRRQRRGMEKGIAVGHRSRAVLNDTFRPDGHYCANRSHLDVAMSLTHITVALGQGERLQRIPPLLREKYEIAAAFSPRQHALIEQALGLVYDRLLSTKVQARFNDAQRPPEGGIGMRIDPTASKSWDHTLRTYASNALSFQIGRLTTGVLEEGKYKFPKISINAYLADPAGQLKIDRQYGLSLARAAYGTIVVYRDEPPKGQFALEINQHYLGQQGLYSQPDFWAGVITHEMCHNLGHGHPVPGDPNFERRHLYQMYLLQISVQTNGVFRYGDNENTNQFRCAMTE